MSLSVTKGWDFALVHANHNGLLPPGLISMRTAAEAHELADAFREAALHMEAVERREAARKDRGVAREVNDAHEAEHRAWPGGTLPSAFTTTPVETDTKVVQIEACECSRWKVCDGHVQSGDVA